MRLGSKYNSTEKYMSLLACLIMVIVVLFPIVIGILYKL